MDDHTEALEASHAYYSGPQRKLRVLVLGSNGFFGRNVASVMLQAGHEVIKASRSVGGGSDTLPIDLTSVDSVARLLSDTKPELIVNCAGIIDPTQDTTLNTVMTTNLLNQVVSTGLQVKSIILAGSASEYGIVEELPVNEDTPLNATAGYGLSKKTEIQTALSLARTQNLPVVVARIFNPIGVGMGPRMLPSRLLAQIQEVRAGSRQSIEVNRLDAQRDLFDIVDAALAVKVIAEHEAEATVYCIGSGNATTVGELAELMLKESGLSPLPPIVQLSDQPEPLVAGQADISRIHYEFGWTPTRTIEETVREIMRNAQY